MHNQTSALYSPVSVRQADPTYKLNRNGIVARYCFQTRNNRTSYAMPPLDRAVTPGPRCIKMTYLLLQQALYVTSLP